MKSSNPQTTPEWVKQLNKKYFPYETMGDEMTESKTTKGNIGDNHSNEETISDEPKPITTEYTPEWVAKHIELAAAMLNGFIEENRMLRAEKYPRISEMKNKPDLTVVK